MSELQLKIPLYTLRVGYSADMQIAIEGIMPTTAKLLLDTEQYESFKAVMDKATAAFITTVLNTAPPNADGSPTEITHRSVRVGEMGPETAKIVPGMKGVAHE